MGRRVPEPPPVPDGTDAIDSRVAVPGALRRLAPGQRAAVVLRFWEDLSIEQTADVLGLSVGTVKSQTARGLRTLREALGSQLLAEAERNAS